MMKTFAHIERWLAALAICIILSLPCAAEDAAKLLTMDEAVKIAMANNKAISIANAYLGKARARVREAKAGDNPQIKVEARYTRLGPPMEFTLNSDDGEPMTINVSPGEQKQASATLSKVVDVFGQIKLGAELADYQRAIQELDLQRVTQQVVLDVKQAYYNALRSEARKEVAEKAVTASEEHLKIAQAQFKAGTAPRFDVTRAEVEMANNKQSLIAAANAVKLAKSALNNVMGIDVNTPTDVQKVEISAQPKASELDVARNTQTAYISRPEALQAKIAVELSQRAVELNKRGLWPTLAGVATGSWTGTATAFSQKLSWTAGLALSFPIWDGGITKARIDEAKSDVDAVQAQFEQLKLAVALEVRSSLLSLLDAMERMSATGENVRQAEEAFRLAKVRYEAGISTSVEVTDAEVALTLARTNEVNASYDYMVALAQLERAIGKQPEFGDASKVGKSS